MDKTRIGTSTDAVSQANREFRRANDAERDLTMMKRRVSTFFLEVDEVVFPEDAPAWAFGWVEWLLTGEVAKPIEEPGNVGLSAQEVADEAGIVVERVTTEEIDSDTTPDEAVEEALDDDRTATDGA